MLYRFDGFVRCQGRVCEKRVIDERRRIAVAPFGMLWPSRRIFRPVGKTYRSGNGQSTVKAPYELVLVDDASYSGTQAFRLLVNAT